MPVPADLDSFLSRNRIGRRIWEQAAIDWEILQAIGADHDQQIDQLRDSADLFTRVIQRYRAPIRKNCPQESKWSG